MSLYACDQCGSTAGVVYIPDPECGGVHAWYACEACRGEEPVVNMRRLASLVERCCRRIYMDLDGYWPSDSERHRLAIALIEAAAIPQEESE